MKESVTKTKTEYKIVTSIPLNIHIERIHFSQPQPLPLTPTSLVSSAIAFAIYRTIHRRWITSVSVID